jgi:hypothetical protein
MSYVYLTASNMFEHITVVLIRLASVTARISTFIAVKGALRLICKGGKNERKLL